MAMQITQVFILIVIIATLLSKISSFFDTDPRLKGCVNDDPEPSTQA